MIENLYPGKPVTKTNGEEYRISRLIMGLDKVTPVAVFAWKKTGDEYQKRTTIVSVAELV